ncbi:hypothetical protein DFQ30_000432 [Apophysomyces sp. BC1015]|nr:hypothetical protein DFQ30_000432 [Apophysomyces sp. BC1015]
MQRQTLAQKLNGVFAIYKPKGWTSRAATNKVQQFLSQKLMTSQSLENEMVNDPKVRIKRRDRIKIGHGGTLDPLAEGVLGKLDSHTVLGVDVSNYMGFSKEYEVTAKFGQATDSYDSDGQVTHQGRTDHLTREGLEAVLPRFRGEISQLPPIYSALKMDGKCLYDYARQGKALPRPIEARQVQIYRLDVAQYTADGCVLKVESGKGTYMRSLVHDLGLALGTYAHMVGLKRTRQAAWSSTEAIPIDKEISLDAVLNVLDSQTIDKGEKN